MSGWGWCLGGAKFFTKSETRGAYDRYDAD